ncbi:MAG TPA: nucleoside transporter C-terminal domain-containing protein [bacterium]|nr:NupC/NupG family nucleoside CNT transporter [Myxococcales bacterium]HQH80146.1 nucleoside transporter C-terminal domain-containing protein [bacterium]
MERYMGVLGIIVLFALAFLMSNNKKRINFRTLIVGFSIQFGMGLLLISWPRGNDAIQWFAMKVTSFLMLTDHGTKFLFGYIVDPSKADIFGFQFAFRVLPIIIFFACFMGILYYLGIMQKIVKIFAWVMSRLMKTSGAESLSCSANIFLGQTEAPLLIRPFLNRCTMSELCAIMVGGFGTIAGSVMAGYIAMGIPAQHIIIASMMAAPASLMVAKIIFPETQVSETAGSVSLPKIDVGSNVLDAASRGVYDGLHLALNVAAMLIAFITLIAFIDKLLLVLDRLIDGTLLGGALMANGEYEGYFPGSLKTILGTIFSPLTFLMGVPRQDVFELANLLGTKLALNEFVAYAKLAPLIESGAITPKAQIMGTYMLCGFANFASIGIQIGGLSALAPERRSDLSKLAMRAMLGGAIVSCLTATIAGILIG